MSRTQHHPCIRGAVLMTDPVWRRPVGFRLLGAHCPSWWPGLEWALRRPGAARFVIHDDRRMR